MIKLFRDVIIYVIFFVAMGSFMIWFSLLYTTKERFMNHKAYLSFRRMTPFPMFMYWFYKIFVSIFGLFSILFGISVLIDHL